MQEVSGSIPLTSTTDDTANRFNRGLQIIQVPIV